VPDASDAEAAGTVRKSRQAFAGGFFVDGVNATVAL
jgi:hypothetical protein